MVRLPMHERGLQLPNGSQAVAILHAFWHGNEHGVWGVNVAALAPVASEAEGNFFKVGIFMHKLSSVIERSHDVQKVFASHGCCN